MLNAVRRAAANLSYRGAIVHRPCIEILEERQLLSNTWFVAPWGAASNPGSISAPFQTIQEAANVAEPGDHVEIRAGVYHETVTPAHSGSPGAPITYEAYDGENVTVSGADPITGWSQYSGAIYSAVMPWDLGEGDNEVFVNGQAINEGAWPNGAVGDFSHPATATMQSTQVGRSTAIIYNSALDQPANTWKGAIIHMDPGQAWVDQTGTVTASSPGSITVSFANGGTYALPGKGNQFYLFGKFQALDGAGQWYRDPTTGQLYVWAPGSADPATLDVEAKHRLYAFNLNGVHDITLSGIILFAATVSTNSKSSDTVLNKITSLYPSQQIQTSQPWSIAPTEGIMLMGANSTIENSTVAFSSNDGIVVGGSGSTVENNVVHDVSYTGADTGGIRVLSPYVTVTHNTIYNSGRDGIVARVPHVSITYNTVHDVGLQTTEAGGIYTSSTNGQGAVIAYNQVYNIHTGGYGGTAIFVDNSSSGWVVHNNVTWNVDYGLKMNYTSNNNQIYNNTLGATKMSVNTNQIGNWYGTKIYNNIFGAAVLFASGASIYNNASSTTTANGAQGAGSIDAGADGVVAAIPSAPGAAAAAPSGSPAAPVSSSPADPTTADTVPPVASPSPTPISKSGDGTTAVADVTAPVAPLVLSPVAGMTAHMALAMRKTLKGINLAISKLSKQNTGLIRAATRMYAKYTAAQHSTAALDAKFAADQQGPQSQAMTHAEARITRQIASAQAAANRLGALVMKDEANVAANQAAYTTLYNQGGQIVTPGT